MRHFWWFSNNVHWLKMAIKSHFLHRKDSKDNFFTREIPMSPEAFWIWKMTLIIICDDPPAASFLEFLPPAKSQPHPLLSTGIMTFASWYFSPLLPFNAAVLILWIFRYQKGSLIRHGHVSIQLCMTSRQFMPVTTFFSYFGGGGDGWKVKLNCNHICQKTNFQL